MKLNMKWKLLVISAFLMVGIQQQAWAAEEHYKFDIKGQHAFIEFQIKHLGYSWIIGRFDRFDGSFSIDDEHPEHNRVNMTLDVSSIDSNHAERDKHLRSADFFDVAKFPKATFVTTSYHQISKDKGILKGKFTLRGVTKDISIEVVQIGQGADPWGGYRRGFEGHTTLHLSDYHMAKAGILGKAAENVELYFSIEGIRQ